MTNQVGFLAPLVLGGGDGGDFFQFWIVSKGRFDVQLGSLRE